MPELKLYTVAQLREWLMYNHAPEGLSEQIIAPSRAWAIIHNPYVKDDDPVVAAIFEGRGRSRKTSHFWPLFGWGRAGRGGGEERPASVCRAGGG